MSDTKTASEPVPPGEAEQAAADARWLVQNAPDALFRRLVGVMIASRQLYAAAVSELERELNTGRGMIVDAELQARRPAHKFTAEVLIQSANNQAAKPFREDQLFETIFEEVFPFLKGLIKGHVKADADEELASAKKAEEHRKTRPVPIGLGPGAELLAKGGKGLLLVGRGAPVRALLHHAIESCLSAKDPVAGAGAYNVVWLADEETPAGDQASRLIRLPRGVWLGAGRSRTALGTFVSRHVLPRSLDVPDLYVVDNLQGLVGLSGRLSPHQLADAYRQLKRYADHVGMVVLAGLPIDGKQECDPGSSDWETLRQHVNIATVVTHKVPDSDSCAEAIRIALAESSFSIAVHPDELKPKNKLIV